MPPIQPTRPPHQRGAARVWLPWLWRLAETLLIDGPEAIALGERDADEVSAILRCAVELIQERTRRRPCARRWRAA
jgi:hypothetical protein